MWDSSTFCAYTSGSFKLGDLSVCVLVQTVWTHSTPHLWNGGKEVVLAQADVASGKADGSLLTIISSAIMLQERSARSTDDTPPPHGRRQLQGARSYAANKPKHCTGALIVYQIPRSSSFTIYILISFPWRLRCCCWSLCFLFSHLPCLSPCSRCQWSGPQIQLELFMMFPPFLLVATVLYSFHLLPRHQMEPYVSAPPQGSLEWAEQDLFTHLHTHTQAHTRTHTRVTHTEITVSSVSMTSEEITLTYIDFLETNLKINHSHYLPNPYPNLNLPLASS